MAGPDFWLSRAGRTFTEGTMPNIGRQLKRIADAMEGQGKEVEADMGDLIGRSPELQQVFSDLRDLVTEGLQNETATDLKKSLVHIGERIDMDIERIAQIYRIELPKD